MFSFVIQRHYGTRSPHYDWRFEIDDDQANCFCSRYLPWEHGKTLLIPTGTADCFSFYTYYRHMNKRYEYIKGELENIYRGKYLREPDGRKQLILLKAPGVHGVMIMYYFPTAKGFLATWEVDLLNKEAL